MKDIFAEKKIEISDGQEKCLQRYYQLLTDWNKKMNLTSITEYEDVVWKHFIDSAFLVRCPIFQKKEEGKIIDLGTGAGFPGIVLSILSPQHQYFLIDSLKKRIDFLSVVKEELGLDHVQLFHGRAEDYGREKEFRNQFDFAVSRAVAELPVLLEYCIPFVKAGGYFVSYKGRKFREEVSESQSALQKLSAGLDTVEEFELRGQDEKRYLLFIENKGLTDMRYPRKAGKVKKQPL